MTDFLKLTGRKFKVIYKNHIDLVSKTRIEDCKFNTIEGILENFSTAEVVINSERHGFNIIPYRSIIYMLEIKEGK